MEELILFYLTIVINYDVIINVALYKCKTEVAHSIYECKFIRRRCVIKFALFTSYHLIFCYHRVANAETLNEPLQIDKVIVVRILDV
jgi:hypothetical protein